MNKQPRLPSKISTLLGWINAAGLLPKAMEVVQGKDSDTAFCDLHEAMKAGDLCPEAMAIFDDAFDEDDCWLLVNELVLLAYRRRATASLAKATGQGA